MTRRSPPSHRRHRTRGCPPMAMGRRGGGRASRSLRPRCVAWRSLPWRFRRASLVLARPTAAVIAAAPGPGSSRPRSLHSLRRRRAHDIGAARHTTHRQRVRATSVLVAETARRPAPSRRARPRRPGDPRGRLAAPSAAHTRSPVYAPPTSRSCPIRWPCSRRRPLTDTPAPPRSPQENRDVLAVSACSPLLRRSSRRRRSRPRMLALQPPSHRHRRRRPRVRSPPNQNVRIEVPAIAA